MLEGNRRYNRYEWLNPLDEALICAFLQGAVYAWCDAHGTKAFAARDFVGDQNKLWQGTPLMVLYEHYHNLHPERRGTDYAQDQAGRALGHLLKRVIVDDKRRYTTHIEEQVRHYEWDGVKDHDHVPFTPGWLREAYRLR